jgi:formate dehydrogenase major subunit
VPGLGITYGRGGATSNLQDLQNADCILIEGSNMAEAHPVGFRHPMIAKEKNGAKLIHVDPRFTRTSALCDIYAPIRAGTDIAFLGGLINYVLQNERYFKDYVVQLHQRGHPRDRGVRGRERHRPLSGWDEEKHQYDPRSWRYEGHPIDYAAVGGSQGRIVGESGGRARCPGPGAPDRRDAAAPSLRVPDPQAQHFAEYTPEMVEKVCGTPREAFLEVAKAICENSGREKTTALCYAVGWTQHSKGVQIIRTAAILQLLLGNIGRPGGGIMALRGHATIQGSTDIATLYNILPGYLPMPDVNMDNDTWMEYVEGQTASTGWWNNFPKYITSIFKAWYGEAFDPSRGDEIFDHFPRLSGDHSYYPTIMAMKDRDVKGSFVFGQNFAVGGPHARLARDALRGLEWLVVLDAFEVETATAWKMDGVKPEECATEVFFIPSALVAEKDGSFTQTQRMLSGTTRPSSRRRREERRVVRLPPGAQDQGALQGLDRRAGRAHPGDDVGLPVGGRARRAQHREHHQGGQRLQRRRPLAGCRLRRAQGRRLDGVRGLDLLGRLRRRVNQARRRKPWTEQPNAAPSGAGRGR